MNNLQLLTLKMDEPNKRSQAQKKLYSMIP